MKDLLAHLAEADRALFVRINGGLHELSDGVAPLESLLRLLNEFGNAWILVVILFVIIGVERTPGRALRRVLELGAVALVGGGGANRLKLLFERPRPRVGFAEAFADGRCQLAFGEAYRSYSFPSGHSALVFALAGILIWWTAGIPDGWRRTLVRAAILVGATLTALARIYAGSHYPGDALAGAGFGLFAGTLVAAISRRRFGPYAPLRSTAGYHPPA